MSINSREKNLLLFLLILIAVFVFYQYSYVPTQEEIAVLQTQKTEKTEELMRKNRRLSKARELQEQYANLSKEMKPLAEKFFPNVPQEEFIVLLHKFAEESGLKVANMNFTDENKEINLTNMDKEEGNAEGAKSESNDSSENKDGKTENPSTDTEKTENKESADNSKEATSGENQENKEGSEDNTAKEIDRENPLVDFDNLSEEERVMKLGVLTVTADFIGTYSQYRAFLTKLDDYQRIIVASHLDINDNTKQEQGNVSVEKSEDIKGNLTLSFYRVDGLEKYDVEPFASLLNEDYNMIK